MSPTDVELLEAAFAGFEAGDAQAVLGMIDDGVRLYPRPEEPGVRAVYEGPEGVMEYLSNWYSQWDEYDTRAVEFLEAGDQVVVVMRETGRMASSGIEIEQDFTHAFRLRDGKLIEWRMYDTHAQALAAVGLAG